MEINDRGSFSKPEFSASFPPNSQFNYGLDSERQMWILKGNAKTPTQIESAFFSLSGNVRLSYAQARRKTPTM